MADAMKPSPFSLLMAVYEGDHVPYLRRAVLSNTVEQSRAPAQVVVVRDGPVPQPLQDFLDALPAVLHSAFEHSGRADAAPDVTVVPLERNQGLAHALNQGLRVCRYEVVVRADSDDIAMPKRCELLVPCVQEPVDGVPVDVVGSAIREFSGDEHHLGQIRRLPAGGAALRDYARLQSPLHHPSVAFRASVVRAAGGYPERAGRFEDYLLWERLMLRGARMANLPEPLVLYRVDAGAYERRGGCTMFRDELVLQRRFRADGFTTTAQFIRNIAVRAVYRLLPTGLRRLGYRVVTALRGR